MNLSDLNFEDGDMYGNGVIIPAHWRRWPISCMRFTVNAVRLQIHALAYNLANLLRALATPDEIETWSLTSLRERLIKAVARLVRHARYAVFHFVEAALERAVFVGIPDLISGLRGPPVEQASALLGNLQPDRR